MTVVAGTSLTEVVVATFSDADPGRRLRVGYVSPNFLQTPITFFQISYLRYVNSSGLLAIDHRLTDAYIDPRDLTQAYQANGRSRCSRHNHG